MIMQHRSPSLPHRSRGAIILRARDLSRAELDGLLDLGLALKAAQKARMPHPLCAGRSLGMIFHKASTRTRVSFEVGMNQLGGNALNMAQGELQLGRGETVRDTAMVLSRYLDAIMIRTFSQADIDELAELARVPVINGLSDDHHPCQALADLLTLRERFGPDLRRRAPGLRRRCQQRLPLARVRGGDRRRRRRRRRARRLPARRADGALRRRL